MPALDAVESAKDPAPLNKDLTEVISAELNLSLLIERVPSFPTEIPTESSSAELVLVFLIFYYF